MLQKSKVAGRRIFREKPKREVIADSYFGFGMYGVAIGIQDFHISFWPYNRNRTSRLLKKRLAAWMRS